MEITVAENLIIREVNCSPSVRTFLRSQTMLENPIWHEKAKRGHSLWNTPRYVRCETKQDGFWDVPRGLWKKLEWFFRTVESLMISPTKLWLAIPNPGR